MRCTAGEYDINSYVTNPEAFAVKNGFVEALQGPGLGIEINEELVRKVAMTTKPWDLKGFVGEYQPKQHDLRTKQETRLAGDVGNGEGIPTQR